MIIAGIKKINHSAGTVRPSKMKSEFKIVRVVVGTAGCCN